MAATFKPHMDPFELHTSLYRSGDSKTALPAATLAASDDDAQATAQLLGRFGGELYPFDPRRCGHPSSLSASLATASAAGQALLLVVGRGFGQPWWHASSGHSAVNNTVNTSIDTSSVAIVMDRFGGAFRLPASQDGPAQQQQQQQQQHHIWADFSLVSALELMPASALTRIVVDWSTWRYMRPMAPGIAIQWRRLVTPAGGSFVFEGGVASYRIVADGSNDGDAGSDNGMSWDHDNPCHVVVKESLVREWLRRFAGSRMDGGRDQASVASPVMLHGGYRPPRSLGMSRLAQLKGTIAPIQLLQQQQPTLPLDTRRILPAFTHKRPPIVSLQTDTSLDRSSLSWLDAVIYACASPLVDEALASFFKSAAGGAWPVAQSCVYDAADPHRTYPIAVRGIVPRWIVLQC